MSQLHIILGLPKNSNAVDPVVLYCGRDGTKAHAVQKDALGPGGWPCVEHVRGASGYRKQGAAVEAPVVVPANKGLDEAIAANHSLKEEIDLLDTQIAVLKAEKEKDAASLAEMIAAHEAQGHSLKHAEARIALLEKELSSARAETRNSSTNTTVDESAPGQAAGAAGPGAINSSAGQEAQTPPPGSQGDGDGSPDSVSSAAPTTTPQVPAAAPKGMQQQAKGRR
jgi:hypothetical protein